MMMAPGQMGGGAMMMGGGMGGMGGMAMGGAMGGMEKRCARCKGRGFVHDSNMNHDKPPNQKCFFCKECDTCHGDGGVHRRAQELARHCQDPA